MGTPTQWAPAKNTGDYLWRLTGIHTRRLPAPSVNPPDFWKLPGNPVTFLTTAVWNIPASLPGTTDRSRKEIEIGSLWSSVYI